MRTECEAVGLVDIEPGVSGVAELHAARAAGRSAALWTCICVKLSTCLCGGRAGHPSPPGSTCYKGEGTEGCQVQR